MWSYNKINVSNPDSHSSDINLFTQISGLYLGDRTLMHREGLEELGPVTHSLWMLNYNSHCAWTRAVRNFYPVATQAWNRLRVNVILTCLQHYPNIL